jgi:hypothetical protein
VSRFDAINGGLCRIKGFKSHRGIRDFLDGTVILFKGISKNAPLSHYKYWREAIAQK